ncbi:metal dependent phosphohydrolase, partial [Chytriomyces sp. MP71]
DSIDCAVMRLSSLFSKQGSLDYIGEPISIAQHSFQAAILAAKSDSSTIQVAALLHDVGHLLGLEAELPPGMDGCGTPDHEGIAARFLVKLGFPYAITHLVANHVNAKRFLCAADSAYCNALTEASKTSLRFQGGPMATYEARAFRADPHCDAILRMRVLDEAAK